MSSVIVVIRKVGFQNSPQVAFIEDYSAFEIVSSNGADHPFDEGVLPRAPVCGEYGWSMIPWNNLTRRRGGRGGTRRKTKRNVGRFARNRN